MRRSILAAAAVLALLAPAAAQAHVTLQPNTAQAGGYTRLDVRVPNERDDAATTKVDVQLPPGFAFVSYEPRPGWKVTVKRGKAEQPIEVEGGFEVDEEVRFEASLPGKGIEPIRLEATKAGPGHYVVGAAALSPPGDWRLELIARISDFDELRTTYTVPIE